MSLIIILCIKILSVIKLLKSSHFISNHFLSSLFCLRRFSYFVSTDDPEDEDDDDDDEELDLYCFGSAFLALAYFLDFPTWPDSLSDEEKEEMPEDYSSD